MENLNVRRKIECMHLRILMKININKLFSRLIWQNIILDVRRCRFVKVDLHKKS